MAKRRRQQRTAALFRVRAEPLFNEVVSCKEPSKLSLSRLTAPAPINGGKGKARQACYLCPRCNRRFHFTWDSVPAPDVAPVCSACSYCRLDRGSQGPAAWLRCCVQSWSDSSNTGESFFQRSINAIRAQSGASIDVSCPVRCAVAVQQSVTSVHRGRQDCWKVCTGLQGGCTLPCDRHPRRRAGAHAPS